MKPVVHAFLQVVIPVYAISSMAALGLGNDLALATMPLRRPMMVLTALLANFVVVPLLALFLIRVLGLEQAHAIGLFLVASGGGAAFTYKLVQAAHGNLALTGGLLLLLVPVTILYLPVVIPFALPEARVDVGEIATTLVASMLLPLAAGFVVRRRSLRWSAWLAPILGRLSTVLLVALVAATLAANLRGIAALAGTPALAAAALLEVGALGAGYALGVPTRESRVVLGLGTGQRNIAAAMIVASSFESDQPLVMVVVFSLVGFAVLFPAAWLLRGRGTWRARPRGARRTADVLP